MFFDFFLPVTVSKFPSFEKNAMIVTKLSSSNAMDYFLTWIALVSSRTNSKKCLNLTQNYLPNYLTNELDCVTRKNIMFYYVSKYLRILERSNGRIDVLQNFLTIPIHSRRNIPTHEYSRLRKSVNRFVPTSIFCIYFSIFK